MSAYVVFGLTGAVPIVICMTAAIKNRSISFPLVFWVLALASVFFWLAAFKLEIKDGMMTYRQPFRRRKSLPLNEIAKVEMKVGLSTYADRFKPNVRLEIEPSAGAGRTPIVINCNVFRRQEMMVLMEMIQPARKVKQR